MPPNSHKTFIHTGFPKTASGTLERHLLIKHPEILNLANPWHEEISHLLHKSEEHFDPNSLVENIEALAKDRSSEKAWVLSNKSLSCNPYMRTATAQRLHALFPDAKVMFTIRNQVTLIPSWYAREWRLLRAPKPFYGRHVGLNDYLEFEFDRYEDSFFVSPLDFDDVIRVYEDIFGRGNIRIFLFEDFRQDRKAYLEDLCEFLGIDKEKARETFLTGHHNPRPIETDLAYLKFRNYFFPNVRFQKFIPGGAALRRGLGTLLNQGPVAKVTLSDTWKAHIEEQYAPGNRRLAERYGLPLAEHGYPL